MSSRLSKATVTSIQSARKSNSLQENSIRSLSSGPLFSPSATANPGAVLTFYSVEIKGSMVGVRRNRVKANQQRPTS